MHKKSVEEEMYLRLLEGETGKEIEKEVVKGGEA